MNLLETYDSLLQDWRKVFAQERTFRRARRLTFGLLVCLRLHLTSRAICAVGRQFVDWAALPPLFPQPLGSHRLFDQVFDRLPVLLPSPSAPVIAALDDTHSVRRPAGVFRVSAWHATRCRRLSTSISAMGCVSCRYRCWSVRLKRRARPAPCRCVSTSRRRGETEKKRSAGNAQAY